MTESNTPETEVSQETVEEEKELMKPIIEYDDFAKMDLRVGTVVEAEAHPNADRLLRLQIDLGALGVRQICAGVKAFYQPEELVNKQVVVIVNLAPRKIRGEMSNGMVLAASDLDGEELKDVILLQPFKALGAGAPIS